MKNIKLIEKSIFYLSMPLVFVGFIFPIKAIEYGASSLQLGVIFAILSLVTIIVNPIIGSFVDKKGYKTSLICGSIIYIGSLLMLHFSNNYSMLLLSSTLSGFASSFICIASDTFVINNSDENNISQNFAIVQQWKARGGFIGMSLGCFILFNKAFSDIIPVFLMYSAFMMASIYFTHKNLPKETYENTKNISSSKNRFSFFKDLISLNRTIKFFLVIVFISAIDGGLLSPVFLTYFKENISGNMIQVSYLYIPAAILNMVLPVHIGKLISKYNKMTIVTVSLALNILCWIYFSTTTDFNILVVLFTVMSIIGTTIGLAWSSIKKSIFENSQIGYKAGLSTFASSLGGAIGALIGGWLYNYSGMTTIMTFKIAISIVTFILCVIFFNKKALAENIKLQGSLSQ